MPQNKRESLIYTVMMCLVMFYECLFTMFLLEP